MIATSTVLAGSATRKPGTVHLQVNTDNGAAILRFTPAFAKQIGRELVRAADESAEPAPHAQTGGRAPILRPSGGL